MEAREEMAADERFRYIFGEHDERARLRRSLQYGGGAIDVPSRETEGDNQAGREHVKAIER